MKSQTKFILFLIWTLVILVVVGMPGRYIPKPVGFLTLLSPDKIIHLALFAPWSFLLLKYFSSVGYQNIFTKNKKLWVVIYGIIYAILTELLQFYVFIGRNGNLYDALADIIGVGLGVFIFNRWINRKKQSV